MYIIFIAIAAILLFFVKQWIHFGVQVAFKRTLRFAIVLIALVVVFFIVLLVAKLA